MADVQKTVDTSAQVWEAVQKLGAKLEALATQYGPDVVELALTVARVDAIHHLVTVLFGLGCPIIAAIFATRWFSKRHKEVYTAAPKDYEGDIRSYQIRETLGWLTTFKWVSVAAGAVMSMILVVQLTDVWTWVGIVRPEVYLAAKALKL